MALVRIFREASSGLTSNLGGSAASPNAGPNNWVTNGNPHTRQAGGGFKASVTSSNAQSYIDAGVAPARIIYTVNPGGAHPYDDCASLHFGWTTFGVGDVWKLNIGYGTAVLLCRNNDSKVLVFQSTSSLNTSADWTYTIDISGASLTLSVTDGTTDLGPWNATDPDGALTGGIAYIFSVGTASNPTVKDLDYYEEQSAPLIGTLGQWDPHLRADGWF